MKLSDVYAVLEGVAPKALSDEYCEKYGAYDNSGILIDCGQEVKKILFSLDFSLNALKKADEEGANVLVTHHPAVYAKIGSVLCGEPQGEKIQRAIRSGISVISMHLNFDCAARGIDYELMRGVGGQTGVIQEPLSAEESGYGRIYDISPVTAEELCARLSRVFSTEKIFCYGRKKRVSRAASFCGAGGSEEGVLQAVRGGADCIISADFKHHVIALAREYGLSVIQLTHYASENYGFQKIYEQIKGRLGAESVYYTDEELL